MLSKVTFEDEKIKRERKSRGNPSNLSNLHASRSSSKPYPSMPVSECIIHRINRHPL
jgi:hypothetical protein